MIKFGELIERIFGVKHHGQFQLPEMPGDTFNAGVSRQGSRSALFAKIEAAGARPGDTVEIDGHGHARVIGRKPEIVVNNSEGSN